MKLITYNELVMNEGGINLQAGMNFGIKGSYSIVLMSTLKNAPYSDKMLEEGVIKYEGHDQYRIAKELKNSRSTNSKHDRHTYPERQVSPGSRTI